MTSTQLKSTETATKTRKIGQVQALNEALDIALGVDPSVFLLGEDIQEPNGGGFGVHKGLGNKYGTTRVRHTPISEQAIMGAAVGAAISGMRPVAEIMLMNFVHVCADQLINHAAKLRYMSGGRTPVPLTVRTATGTGGGFGAQHSDMLEAQLVHAAGLKVVVPSNPADAKGLLLSCIFDDDPCVFVEMSQLYFAGKGEVPEGDYRVPLGKARIARSGSDVTLLTYGRQVGDCLTVADTLAADGIDVEVVDLRTLNPWTPTPYSGRWPRRSGQWSYTRRYAATASAPNSRRPSRRSCSANWPDRCSASPRRTPRSRTPSRWRTPSFPDLSASRPRSGA